MKRKNQRKRIYCVLIVLAMLFSISCPAFAATNANVTSPPTGMIDYRPDVPDGFTLSYTWEDTTLARATYHVTNAVAGIGNLALTVYIGASLTNPAAAVFSAVVGINSIVGRSINEITGSNGGYPLYEVEYVYECDNPMQYGYPYVYWHLYEYEIDVIKLINGREVETTETYWYAYYELPVLPR